MTLPQAAPGDARQPVEACPPISRNGFTTLYCDRDSKIDVVLLHGLNGHPESTWTHKSTKYFWPWELRRHIPNARIMVYGYDADVSPQFGTNLIRIKSLASTFLSNLVNMRQEEDELNRPLLFIGHSLGGLVIKKALILASQAVVTELDDAHLIYQATKGLIFFGTPHAGSAAGKLHPIQILKKIAKVAFTEVPPKLDSALESHSDELLDLADDFRTISLYTLRQIVIYSYAESRTTPKLNALVVDEFSAFVGYDKEVKGYIQADHEAIVKFDGETDADYKNVWGKINRVKRLAASVAATVPGQVEMSVEEIAILRCLNDSASGYEYIKDSNSSRRVENTCLWLLHDETYKNSLNQGTRNVLLVSAGPGTGKSVLAAFLVDELKRQFQSNAECTICYFFFQESNYKLKTVTSALCALLLQLLNEEPTLLVHAVKEYRIKGQKFAEDFRALCKIFTQALQGHRRSKVICVIDGLDECEEKDKALLIDYLVNGDELKPVENIEMQCQNKLTFIFTSRSYGWIERQFPPSSIIKPDAAAINKEIALVVDSEVSKLGSRMNLSIELQNTLKERLAGNADHSFLWVSLVLDQFKNRKDFTGSERQCWAILNDLPVDLYAAYEGILKRSTNRRLAQRILHIIIAAARPLSLAEMDIALAIDTECESMQDLKSSCLPSIEGSIQDICGGFVNVIGTQPNQKIDLVHHTAKEFLIACPSSPMPCNKGFLELIIWAIYSVCFPKLYSFLAKLLGLWKYSLDPNESNRVLAEICLTYLRFEEFGSHPLVLDLTAKALDVRGTVDRYAREHGFLDYAATHWAEHFRETQHDSKMALINSALEACDTESKKFHTWFQVYWAEVDSLWPCPENLTSLMVGSLCGHKALVQILLAQDGSDIAAKDDSGKTALIWAVENGHEDVAEVLLRNGADVNAKDRNEWTALHTASAKGYRQLVELLRANHANVTAVTQRGHAALHLAARDGYLDLVRLLLDYGTEVDTKSAAGAIGGYTALHLAVMNGHKEVAHLLLENGADVNAKTGIIGEGLAEYAPLHFAVIDGHMEVAKLLLDNNANLSARDALGETPLHKVALTGHDQMTRLLLRKAVRTDIDAKSRNGETPLHMAVKDKNHAAVLHLLLTANASIAVKDKNGALALHYAAAKGHDVAVEQLIKLGAELAVQDDEGKRVLHYAARCHENSVAQLLIKENVDLEAQDADGRTALHDAAINGSTDVVALLISEGADPSMKDKTGKTALHFAVSNGREGIVKLLLANHEVNPEPRDNDGRTPFSWALPNHHQTENVVKIMLNDERICPNSRDKNGRTPFSRAMQNSHPSDPLIGLLLDTSRVDPDLPDNNGRTPLSWVAENNHNFPQVIEAMLASSRVIPDTPDKDGRTPLSWAARHDNDQVIRLLLASSHVIPDAPDKDGRTPLSWLAENSSGIVTRILLASRHVAPDAPDKDGRTPFSWAAGKGRAFILEYLLDTGNVQPDSRDKNGRTPLSWAAENDRESVVKLLLDTCKVQPDFPDKNGRTPLSWAAEKGWYKVAKLLLKTGQADPKFKDMSGRTPISWAMENNNSEVASLFV